MEVADMLESHRRLIITLGDYGELNSRSLMIISNTTRNYKYLRQLLQEGLIEFYEFKAHSGKGRKQKIYRLTSKGYEAYRKLTDRTPIVI